MLSQYLVSKGKSSHWYSSSTLPIWNIIDRQNYFFMKDQKRTSVEHQKTTKTVYYSQKFLFQNMLTKKFVHESEHFPRATWHYVSNEICRMQLLFLTLGASAVFESLPFPSQRAYREMRHFVTLVVRNNNDLLIIYPQSGSSHNKLYKL
jgi:hypothetical protein